MLNMPHVNLKCNGQIMFTCTTKLYYGQGSAPKPIFFLMHI